ncbi:transcription antitermination factor NusB [Nafulsella turpanensis]|uniref:transcription antitermination factor NusB n=1 Tax=Nafulsella turpanensis TaxID=1265690 RepID=UPI00036F60A7|nr:transcription antitermination factor NusB [Nafulsella turpanensis]
MQNFFAFIQCRQSDFHLGLDLIKEEFAPDLNSMEVQDPVKLEADRKAASDLFAAGYKEMKLAPAKETTEAQTKAAQDALQYYDKLVRQDTQHLRKSMVAEAEKIAERYLEFLLLLTELVSYARNERDKRLSLGRSAKIDETNWLNNRVVEQLAQNKPLQVEAIKHNLQWNDEQEFIKQLYKEVLGKDETFLKYLEKSGTTFEDDKQIVLHIIKKVFFKNELVSSLMDQRDLYWAENREVLKSMVQRTVKALEEENNDQFELAELSYNWEDDKEFFIDLFNLSIRHEKEYEEMISQKSKNWDVERLALLDRVILIMALCEMINFSSIPVKVTINEYIELAKKYSTPKSKFFINGVLDVLSNELQEKGLIKKSGRGLIDNK